jgi:membrane protein
MKIIHRFISDVRDYFTVTGKESRTVAVAPHDFAFKDWRIALLETRKSVVDKRLGILAAGIAYYATLAFFPLAAASVAIAALFVSDGNLHVLLHALEQYLPSDFAKLVGSQLETALANETSNGLVAIIAIAIAFFTASSAMKNLVKASNVAYACDESRSFVKLRLTSIVLTIMLFICGVIVMGCLFVDSTLLESLGLTHIMAVILSLGRWVAIMILVAATLAAFYRYGPNRPNPHWQWVSWGAAIASVFWLFGTVLFFLYVKYLANYTESYSLFAGIIVLMVWMNLSSFIILLGAEINHRLEQRTTRKTA